VWSTVQPAQKEEQSAVSSTHQLDPQLVDALARCSVRVAHLHVLPQKLIVAQYQCLPATHTHIAESDDDMIATGLEKDTHSMLRSWESLFCTAS
jgi:hypothetical protein